MEKLCINFDTKPKSTIGFVCIPSDITLDTEAPPLLSQIPGILWRFTKMGFDEGDDQICKEVYERSKKNISTAAKSFLPSNPDSYGSLDVIAMCCTSLSFTLGTSAVHDELSKGYPTSEVTVDMATSVVRAIKAVTKKTEKDVPQIALLTPYIDAVHDVNVQYLKENGIDVIQQHNLRFQVDTQTTSMSPESIFQHSKALVGLNSEIDVLFIGCSAFRSTGYGFIDRLEEEIGTPVITSNQAMMWNCLRVSKNVTDEEVKSIKGYGVLFQY